MSAFLLYIAQKKQTIESERVLELSPNNYKKAMKPGDVMKFKLKPLAYLVMLAISNAVAPAYAVDEIPLPIESAYPDALKDQLPDFEHAAGNGVTFEGPGSTFTGTTPPAPTLDVNTTEKNTLINWGGRGFDVGADATVNFNPGVSGTSVLNYDSTGSMSIVNGAVNANGAKLFLVNPDGISDTSGSFTALIANDAENVTLGTDGRLRIKNAGERIYGPVSGQVDTSQDINVDLVGGSSGNSSNVILGGDNTRINISNPSSGANLISNTKFAANKTTISASEQSSASLRLENTSGGNLTINNFKDTIVSGKTNLDGVTVNNPSALSTFSSDSATGSLRNIDVNNGSVDLTQTGGVLIIDGMKHDSYIGNFEASVSGGAVLDIRNSVINLNSDGGLEDSDDLPAGVEDQEIDNSALFSTDTGGGTVSLTNSAIIAEGSIYFEDNLKVGTLNLTNTDLLVPEGNVMVTPGTKIIMENGFALDSDFNPNGFTRGVIVIDATKVEGTIDSGKQYFLPDDDYGEYSSDKQIVLGFNQIKASGGGAMENRQEFSDVASQPGAPSDIPSTGGGQEEDPPVVDIPEIPDDGSNPGNPGTEPGSGGETDPGTEPGDGGETDPGTDPGDGGETDPGANPGNGGGTDPGTEPGDGGETDPGTEPGNGGETDPGTEPGDGTDPGTDPGNGGETDTGTEPGDGGETDPGTEPGDGGETNPGTEPGDGGETDPGTEPGNGGETDPGTDPGNGGETDPGAEPGNGGETDQGTEPGNGGGTDPGTEPGDGGGTNPGAEPGEGGSTTPGDNNPDNPGSGSEGNESGNPATPPGSGSEGGVGGNNPDEDPSQGEADDNQDILNPDESDPLIDELLEPSEEIDLLLDETEEECESSEGGREESCESEVAN